MTLTKPIEDFYFEPQSFATMALDLKQTVPTLLNEQNELALNRLRALASDEPFSLVAQDLQNTKEYAIKNILATKYADIGAASLYNLELKGKNFRSAILFTLAKAIYAAHPQADLQFEETKLYT